MSRRVLVTGGTGAIGPVLVKYLSEQGMRVRVFVRQPPPAGLLPADVELVYGDITDAQALTTATANIDTVFHLAARLHINNPTPELASAYERVNVDGTRCVVAAAQAAGVRRLVFFSTISVYGPGGYDKIFTEESPPNPVTLYALTKRKAEEIVLSARQPDTGAPLGVVLRMAAVYGPRVKGNYARLIQALKYGCVRLGPGTNRRTLIYEADVAAAAILAANHPRAAGQIYNVTDGRMSTFLDIQTAICQGLNKTSPKIQLPLRPVRSVLGLVEKVVSWIGKSSPVGKFTIDKLTEDVAVSGEKIKAQLGFTPQFDLAAGWEQTVKYFNQDDISGKE